MYPVLIFLIPSSTAPWVEANTQVGHILIGCRRLQNALARMQHTDVHDPDTNAIFYYTEHTLSQPQ